MPEAGRGTRPVGRVALVDFYLPNPPEGWHDWPVYVLGLNDYPWREPPPGACGAVLEAYSFFFKGYGKTSDPYPHIVAPRPEPLFSILSDIREVKRIDEEHDRSGQYVRLTGAKMLADGTKAILMSGDSRGYWPTMDPLDIDWNRMHYDEKLLTVDEYRRIVSLDEYAFLRALGVRIPEQPADT